MSGKDFCPIVKKGETIIDLGSGRGFGLKKIMDVRKLGLALKNVKKILRGQKKLERLQGE